MVKQTSERVRRSTPQQLPRRDVLDYKIFILEPSWRPILEIAPATGQKSRPIYVTRSVRSDDNPLR
jgi:hypothetical protein